MFRTRAISSIFLVVIALATILSGGVVLGTTLCVISLIAFFELTKATKVHTEGKKINAMEGMGCILILSYYASVFLMEDDKFTLMIVLFAVILFLFVYVFAFPTFVADQVMSSMFAFIYGPIMLSYVYLTRNLEKGIYLVWMIFIASWISDTCAYLVGVTIGKHKLAPKLSPKKSVEGSIGGIVGAILIGGIFGFFLMDVMDRSYDLIWMLALIGGIGSVISQIGDLAASAIKRNHDIKDYGKLIPGHGGIMDRFDSVIFTAPIIYYLALFILG